MKEHKTELRRKTFYLHPDIDTALKIRAAKLNIRFSDVVNEALTSYLKIDKEKR